MYVGCKILLKNSLSPVSFEYEVMNIVLFSDTVKHILNNTFIKQYEKKAELTSSIFRQRCALKIALFLHS